MRKAVINTTDEKQIDSRIVKAIYKAMDQFEADTAIIMTVDIGYAEIDLLKNGNCVEWAYPIVVKSEE
jgi:hypothetical protein